jgi:hypothetical protein
MSVPAAPSIHSAPFPLKPIAEDSTCLKTICCIPFYGAISSSFVEASLRQQCNQTRVEPILIEIIHIKNQYKIASVIRSLFTIAVLIAAVAYKIIPATLFFTICIGVHIAMTASQLCTRNQNIHLIKELETTGYRAGMKVW